MRPSPVVTIELEEARAALGSLLGGADPVTAVEIEENGFSTKLSTFFITATHGSGRVRALFVKRIGTEPGAAHPDRPDRERLVYEEVLPLAPGIAPSCLGVANIAGDDYLVLERVGGWDLRYQGIPEWTRSVRALAEMHATFLPHASKLRSQEFLVPRDQDHYMDQAAAAAAVAGRVVPEIADAISDVVDHHELVAAALWNLPQTLVHGDLAPKNVLAEGERTWIVDWEWAGAGCGLLDLVDLVYGFDAAAEAQLVSAYLEVVSGTGLVPADGASVRRALDMARLQRILFRLSRSADWGVDRDQIEAWVRAASALAPSA